MGEDVHVHVVSAGASGESTCKLRCLAGSCSTCCTRILKRGLQELEASRATRAAEHKWNLYQVQR